MREHWPWTLGGEHRAAVKSSYDATSEVEEVRHAEEEQAAAKHTWGPYFAQQRGAWRPK